MNKKKRYDIEKKHFESIFNDRFLEFFDDYPQSKSLIKTYGYLGSLRKIIITSE
jgi:hypothetical protein